MKLAVLVPTFNEIANVGELTAKVKAAAAKIPGVHTELLFVDDQSPDGTAAEVERLGRELGTESFAVTVLVKPDREGFGAACIYGYTTLLERAEPPDWVVQMDADLSHNPLYLPSFAASASQGVDFVNASRYLRGGGTPDWTFGRKLLSRGGNIFARTVLGRRVSDYTGGYALYSAGLLRRIDVASIEAKGYGFQLVLKFRASRAAKRIVEIPIVFLDRENGVSKMPPSTLFKSLLVTLNLRFRNEWRPRTTD